MCQDAEVAVPSDMMGEEAVSSAENGRVWKAKDAR